MGTTIPGYRDIRIWGYCDTRTMGHGDNGDLVGNAVGKAICHGETKILGVGGEIHGWG